MEMEVEAQEETARETTFRIHLIVSKILSECNLPALKNLRLVSRSWNELAHAEILKRSLVCLQFYYSHDSNAYKVYSRRKKPTKRPSLQDFVNVLEKSRTFNPYLPFPCQQFCIYQGDLKSGGAFEFFQSHGAHIQSLILTEVSPSESTFVSVLGVQAPNVEKLSVSLGHDLKEWVPEMFEKPPSDSESESNLELDSGEEEEENDMDVDEEWEDVDQIAARQQQEEEEHVKQAKIPFHSHILHTLSLPKLRVLHFSDLMHQRDFRHGVALQLFKSAPNLKAVGNFPITEFPFEYFRENPQKVTLLKEFTLFERMDLNYNLAHNQANPLENEALLYQMKGVLDMLNFTLSHLRLEILRYGFHVDGLGAGSFAQSPELCEALRTIILTSWETLKKLEWHYSDTLLKMKQVRLVNLRQLQLHLSSTPGTQFYPALLKLLFRKLSWLRLIFVGGGQEDVSTKPWKNYWGRTNIDFDPDSDSDSDSNSDPNYPGRCILRGVLDLILSDEFPSTSLNQPENDNCWTYFGRVFPNLQRLTSWAACQNEVYPQLFKMWPDLRVVTCGSFQMRKRRDDGQVERIETQVQAKKESDDDDYPEEYSGHHVQIPELFSLY